jgi:hypothetical protein
MQGQGTAVTWRSGDVGVLMGSKKSFTIKKPGKHGFLPLT